MQFKESLETQSINLGKTYFDGRLKVIYSWHQIASEHALEVTKTQYTILKSTHKVYEKPHISWLKIKLCWVFFFINFVW